MKKNDLNIVFTRSEGRGTVRGMKEVSSGGGKDY